MYRKKASIQKVRSRALLRHGILTRVELTGSCGLSGSAIDRGIRSGDLVRLHPGIFRLGGHPQTWEGDVLAAQLAGGDGAFSSHRTAGNVYELDGVPERTIEVSVYQSRPVRGAVVHRLRPHDRPRVRTLNELRVACLERTIIDLGAVLPDDLVSDALDDALRRRLTTVDRLKTHLDAAGGSGRNGSSILRRLLAVRDGSDAKVRTSFESKMLWIVRNLPLPAMPNFRLVVGGRTRYLDFAFPPYRLGVECHSARWHRAHRQWLNDIERDRHLAAAGWLILYFAWEEVIGHPQRVLSEISDALRMRGATVL